jgi:phospholipid/cholesterol/gamma-HCH transport system substrate-binding protein
MKRDTINYALVGVSVLVALGLLLATLFAITGRTGAATPYHVHFSNVAGLGYGAPVYYEGFRIGQVTAVQPVRVDGRTRYRVELAVREDWIIPADSVAQRQASGLLADMAVGIREGSSATPLPAGGELVGIEGGDVFTAMNDLAGELTILTRDQLRPMVDALSLRFESITGNIDSGLPLLVGEAQQLLGRLNRAAEGIEQMAAAPNREAIAATLQDVRAVASELGATQQRADQLLGSLVDTVDENRPALRQSLRDLERTISAVAQRIDVVTHHLESSSRNLDEFSREIRRSPNRLLFTPPADRVEE